MLQACGGRLKREGFRLSTQVDISEVDGQSRRLPNDKYRVFSINGVTKKRETTQDAEIPEHHRDDTLFCGFARDPLDKKSREKEGLSDKANRHPYRFVSHD